MPLNDLNPKQILDASEKHVALIGRFSLGESGPTTWTGAELGEAAIPFELGYRERVSEIGGREWRSFEVVCPAVAPPGTRAIQLQGSPLESALGKGEGSEREVGGRVFVQLLDALDGLRPYWHPEFDRLLAGGFFFFCQGKKFASGGREVLAVDSELKKTVGNVRVNQALLAYFRGSPQPEDEARATAHLRLALEGEPLAELLLREAPRYRAELIQGQPGQGEIARTLYTPKADQKAFLQAIESVALKGRELPVLYREFRKHAEVVERISRCEPLTALMLWWLFGKLTDLESADEVAKVLYEQLYQARKEAWKPRLGTNQLREDQVRYRGGMEAAYRDFVQGLEADPKKAREDDARAILFRVMMVELEAHREASWQPSERFGRADLIGRQVRVFMELAVETIPGVGERLKVEKAVLDGLKPVYRDFEAEFGASLTGKKLGELLAPLPEDWRAWVRELLDATAALSGEELGNKFREAFHAEVARRQGKQLAEFLTAQGKEMARQLTRTGEVYRRQLESQEGTGKAVINAGGSLLGTGLSAPAKVKAGAPPVPVVRAGAQEMYRRAVSRPGAQISVPEVLAKRIQGQAPESVAIEQQKGPAETVEYTAVLGPKYEPASPSPEGAAGGDALQDLAKLLDEHAAEMAKADVDLERVRGGVLEAVDGNADAAKAPARGRLRALLLGEYLLAAPGTQSTLGQDHSSLGTAALLEMVQKVGARGGYEQANRAKLVSGVDPACGVADLNFHEIWEISRGQDGEAKIEEVVAYWRDIAHNVFQVRQYVEDMEAAKELVALVKRAGAGARLTWYNATLGGHAFGDQDDLCVWSRAGETPPPALLVVSRQAVPNPGDLESGLATFEAKITAESDSVFSHANNGTEVGKVAALPLLLLPARPAAATRLPWIHEPVIPGSWFVSRLGRLNGFPQALDSDYRRFREITGGAVGEKTTRDALAETVLLRLCLGPVVTSKLASHLLAQMSRGDVPPAFREGLGAAWAWCLEALGVAAARALRVQAEAQWKSITGANALDGGVYPVGVVAPNGKSAPEKVQTLGDLAELLKALSPE